MPHVQLASRRFGLGPVGFAIDHHGAHAANAFATIVIKRDRFVALGRELFVKAVDHFQKRHVGRDVVQFVLFHSALVFTRALTPDIEMDDHDL